MAITLFAIANIARADSADDLAEFKTPQNAQTIGIQAIRLADRPKEPGILGIHTEINAEGKLAVIAVQPQSAAEAAGVHAGDILLKFNGEAVDSPLALSSKVALRGVGDAVKLSVVRNDEPWEFSATLAPASRPLSLDGQHASLGVRTTDPLDEDGARVVQVDSASPGAKAGIATGDLILRLDNILLTPPLRLSDALAFKKPSDTVTVTLLRDGKEIHLESRLTLETTTGSRGTGRGGGRGIFTPGGRAGPAFGGRNYFRRDVLRLLVVGIEFSDIKHNPDVADKDWDEEFFSKKTFVKTNATGQTVYGSVNDYFQEQSYGNLRVNGKMAGWVELAKKRAEYDQTNQATVVDPRRGGNKASVILNEAIDKLLARDGANALNGYDAIIFIYAGTRATITRASPYWPHQGSFTYQGQRWSYFLVEEGGRRMTNVSLFGHETGHILGLPDLYAAPESPGSVGLGEWSAMSNEIPGGRPQQYCAWCKEQLGWLRPAVIDPAVRQKLILGAVEDGPRECFKILARPDGSEYYLLENRQRKGFDASLRGEGLLIWHIVNNRPALVAAHGVSGPLAPSVFLSSVPYPSLANNSFTPYTVPSSRPTLEGSAPIYITNIRRLADGRITFYVGYEFD